MRYHKLLLLAVLVVLVSGATCERGGGKTTSQGPFIGGTEGLQISFIDDAPPSSGIFEGESFPVEVELVNMGENEVGEGDAKIYLVGTVTGSSFKRDKDSAVSDIELFAIEEGTEGSIEDSTIVSLGNTIYQPSPPMTGPTYSFNVKAQVCYPYRTKVQLDNFCVPSDERTPVGNEECGIDSTVNLIEKGDNSAGPLQVTSFTESKGTGYVKLRIDVNNQGTGEVTPCGENVPLEDRDKIRVTLPQDVECSELGDSNEGEVKLRDGHAVLRCTRNVNNQGPAYSDRFAMSLAYDYMQETIKQVTVNKKEI